MVTKRYNAVDFAKGIAIILIVCGHVWRGLQAADLIRNQLLFSTVDHWVYMSHLSVFAFAAGLFLSGPIDREGAAKYVRRRNIEYFWLYLVWSIAQNSFKLLATPFVNQKIDLGTALALWVPQGQLWFLGWISVMICLAALIKPWRNKARGALGLALGGVLSFACWGVLGDYLFLQGYSLAIFFFAATVIGGPRLASKLQECSWAVLALSVLAFGTLFVLLFTATPVMPPTVDLHNQTPTSILLSFITSGAGVMVIILGSELISRLNKLQILTVLGQQSLAIFLAHIIFAASTRIALAKLGVTNLWIQLVLGVLVGIAAPLALQYFAGRLRLAWLFAAPKWMQPKPSDLVH
jgi:fucose 4-O-acetylase-like acetyltransferase